MRGSDPLDRSPALVRFDGHPAARISPLRTGAARPAALDEGEMKTTSALYCGHANEVPMACPCNANCYCKAHTCKSAAARKPAPSRSDLERRLNDLEKRLDGIERRELVRRMRETKR